MKSVIVAVWGLVWLAGVALAQQSGPLGVQPGSRLPPLSGVGLDGSPVDLDSLLGRTTVVLSLWSVHCTDCIRELDDLRAVVREFPPDEVTVVAVNTDSGMPVERIAGFVRRYEASRGALGVRHLLDREAAVVNALAVTYIPVLVVVDRVGTVASVLTGYSDQDRPRLSQALDQGQGVTLGAWGEGLRGRLLTLLRGQGPGGRMVEWGSFRVETGMPLFGLYDARGWLVDVAGRRDPAVERARVEEVVGDRLRIALLREAAASVGLRLPATVPEGEREVGLRIPESPFAVPGPWSQLYRAVRFDELLRVEQRAGTWLEDEYWAGLVGNVDLGALRERLRDLGVPAEPVRVRVVTASDFDYKPRALLQSLVRNSYRVQAVQGQAVVYYGDATRLAEELSRLTTEQFTGFVEVWADDEVRLEVY